MNNKPFKPYSNNIIFFDSEFSSNDPYVGEILSIGLVKPNGEELYLEINQVGELNDWVKENILPHLTNEKISREEAVLKIKAFMGEEKPYMITFVNAFDIVYLHKLFNSKSIDELPFYWLPIDFASILFGNGYDPEQMLSKNVDEFCRQIGVDNTIYNKHNALDDARLLKDIYTKLEK